MINKKRLCHSGLKPDDKRLFLFFLFPEQHKQQSPREHEEIRYVKDNAGQPPGSGFKTKIVHNMSFFHAVMKVARASPKYHGERRFHAFVPSS
mgnify:CR=1 FL=1